MKIAGYMRTSTRKQDLDGQRRTLEAWARKNRHALTLFEDDHVSGRRTDRAGVENLMAAIERGEVQGVALTELSRIGRSTGFVHRFVELCAGKGVKIHLLQSAGGFEAIDASTLQGKMFLSVLAMAADVEWHLIQERNARGRATIAARGIRVGRKRQDVSEAALRALREKDLGVRAIARELGVSAATVSRRLRELGLGEVS